MALHIGHDLSRAIHEVPPWGWGVIGIGGLYLILHHAKASTGTGSPLMGAPLTPGTVDDKTGGFSAYIDSLNSSYSLQGEHVLSALTDIQNQNNALLDSIRNTQAGGLAGGGVGDGAGTGSSPGTGSSGNGSTVPVTVPDAPDPSTFINTIAPVPYDPGVMFNPAPTNPVMAIPAMNTYPTYEPPAPIYPYGPPPPPPDPFGGYVNPNPIYTGAPPAMLDPRPSLQALPERKLVEPPERSFQNPSPDPKPLLSSWGRGVPQIGSGGDVGYH